MNLRTVRDLLADPDAPLSRGLLQAKVLASLLQAGALREYVDRELRGYDDGEVIPQYRRIPIDSVGSFVSGIRSVRDHPIPLSDLPNPLREWATKYVCADGVAVIERLISTSDQHMIWMQWPHEYVAEIPTTGIGGYAYSCTDASRCLSTERLQGVLDKVRNRVLDIVLDLAEQFPHEQESEQQLSALPKGQVLTIINTHIHGDHAVVGAGNIVTQSVLNVQQQNIQTLVKSLEELGVADEDREELQAAIIDDKKTTKGDEGQRIGPRVRSWLGKLVSKAAEKSVEEGVSSALPHIVAAIGRYFSS